MFTSNRLFGATAATIIGALLLTGCSDGDPAIMPDVVGKKLDVAKSDLERDGFDEVEVLGGGMFGVVVESNWIVCSQEPSSGAPITTTPRLTVDRSCDDEPSEEAAPSATPSEEPSEPAPAEPAPAGPKRAEVVKAFRKYLDERAAAGVVIAKAATDVSFSRRVVQVTFDPAAVGLDQATFDEINPFNNPYDSSESLADFVATLIAFDDKTGNRLRPAIDLIEALRPDGSLIGRRTTAEIVELNELGAQ